VDPRVHGDHIRRDGFLLDDGRFPDLLFEREHVRGLRRDVHEALETIEILSSQVELRIRRRLRSPSSRIARSAGARVSYLAADFNGLERLAARLNPRVTLAVTSPPDRDGWLSFGVQAGANYRPFLDAARDLGDQAVLSWQSQAGRLQSDEPAR
jgi:hypothetical protein